MVPDDLTKECMDLGTSFKCFSESALKNKYRAYSSVSWLIDRTTTDNDVNDSFSFTEAAQYPRAEAVRRHPNLYQGPAPLLPLPQSYQSLPWTPSSDDRISVIIPEGMGRRTAHLFEVHASHTTHAAHASHASHASHTSHTAHATHATHATHIEVFIDGGCGAFLLIFINPLAKVGLNVRAFCLREARPVFELELLFTKSEDESA